jgi:hypothetical protein
VADFSGQRAAGARSDRRWVALPSAHLAALALFAFIALKLLLLFVLALNLAFVMDEYWTAVHGLVRLDDLYREIWPAKTVLYAAFFRLPHLLAENSVRIMLLARAQQALLAMVGLGLVYGISRNIGRGRIEAWLAVAVVLAFAGYIEWIFMVRPEPIALGFGLAGLWFITRAPGYEGASPRAGVEPIFVAGLLSGLAFLTEQKAIYLNLALGLALVGDALVRRSVGQALRDGTVLVFGWVLVVTAYYLFFALQGAELLHMLRRSLAGPTLQNRLSGHLTYEGGLRQFVVRSLLRDPVLYTLCFIGLLLCGWRLAALESAERRAWIFSVAITVMVFAQPSPWPYNFVLVIPFLALWAPQVVTAIPAGNGLTKHVALTILVTALGMSFVRNVQVLAHNNAFQNETVRRAELLLRPGDTYFDGIGMIVTHQQAGWKLPGQVISWDTPTLKALRGAVARGDVNHFERIFAGAPKLWILSYRTLAIEDILTPYLMDAYIPIYPNVLIAGRALDGDIGFLFRVRWPGRYRLFDAFGRPSKAAFEIDGDLTDGVVALDKGPHRVRLTGTKGPLYLLPADIAGVSFDMTTDLSQKPIFQDVYTF